MTRWKYLLVIVALVSWLAGQLLADVSRYVDWPLLYVSGLGWLALLLLNLSALVRHRWYELTIFSLTLVVIILPGFGVTQPAAWLQAAGFRIYASPLEEYLATCRLFDFFDDDGIKQQFGQCPSVPQTFNSRIGVIYDTTGQFALPPERRTRAWKSAISWHLSAGSFLAEENHDEPHIFGNFYSVLIPLEKEDGNDLK